jgi:hypothetical protein
MSLLAFLFIKPDDIALFQMTHAVTIILLNPYGGRGITAYAAFMRCTVLRGD